MQKGCASTSRHWLRGSTYLEPVPRTRVPSRSIGAQDIAILLIAIVMIMKTIQITLDDHVHRRAKALALSRGITLGEVVRQAVAAFIHTPGDPESTSATVTKEVAP